MWLHRIPPNAAAAATGEALARAWDPLLATVTTVRIGVGSFAAGESAARKVALLTLVHWMISTTMRWRPKGQWLVASQAGSHARLHARDEPLASALRGGGGGADERRRGQQSHSVKEG